MATHFPEEPEDIVKMGVDIQSMAAGVPLLAEDWDAPNSRIYPDTWPGDVAERWGMGSIHEVVDSIVVTLPLMPEDKDVEAVANALGLKLDGTMTSDARNMDGTWSNLTQRRYTYAERVNISPRSLQDREKRGARTLAKQIKVLRESRKELFKVAELERRLDAIDKFYKKAKVDRIIWNRIAEAQAMLMFLENSAQLGIDSLAKHGQSVNSLRGLIGRMLHIQAEVDAMFTSPAWTRKNFADVEDAPFNLEKRLEEAKNDEERSDILYEFEYGKARIDGTEFS